MKDLSKFVNKFFILKCPSLPSPITSAKPFTDISKDRKPSVNSVDKFCKVALVPTNQYTLEWGMLWKFFWK